MKTIVVSHALYKPGMDILDGKVNVVIPDNGDSDVIIEDLKKADGFILRIGKIDRKAILACPNLKVITRPGVGVDNVDVKTATEQGIPVVICPAANAHAVAEHTIALMFAIGKNLVESDAETRQGNFGIRNKYAAIELAGRTLSILGFGRIGKEVARLANTLGMNVVAYDPYATREQVEQAGYTYAGTVEEAVGQGDFITLHMPSLPSTKKMVGAELLRKMKPTAFLINCARGDIVDEESLCEALSSHTIAGAAVDVLSKEPMDSQSPLMTLPNFIVTPHMAAQTQESTAKIVMMAAKGTLAVLSGEKWPDVCNPEVYEHPRWKKEYEF